MESGPHDNYQDVRPYLFAVAYRMTGSAADAEDLVQDAWLRFLDAGSPAVNSLQAYLTTIVSRLALDHLKSARVQREQYAGEWLPEPVLTSEVILGPVETVEQREEVSIAFLTLLERLTPEQRVVYVLREDFGFSYDDIAGHLDKSPTACRQVFHRAQGRIDKERPTSVTPPAQQRDMLDRFGQALASGDAARITELLSSDAVWVSDGGGKRVAFLEPVLGVVEIAHRLDPIVRLWDSQRHRPITIADLNGMPALIMWNDEGIETVWLLTLAGEAITGMHALRNPDKLRHLEHSIQDIDHLPLHDGSKTS